MKGPFCFVYKSKEINLAPKYAVSLAYLVPRNKAGTTVSLESSLGEIEYEMQFENAEIAREFVKVVKEQASTGEADIIRKVRRATKTALRQVPVVGANSSHLIFHFVETWARAFDGQEELGPVC